MSDQSSYQLHGEIHPFLQKKTATTKEQEKSPAVRRDWDQLPKESATAYAAFLMYLDLGPHNRSQAKLAKVIYGNERSTGQVAKWSINYDWLNRSESWDRYCAENRLTKMEDAIAQAEDVMLGYLPKVVLNLARGAAGEHSLGRSEMRAISDFLDRVGPAKQQRAQPTIYNQNLTINQAPKLPDQVVDETGNIEDAQIIMENAEDLIPENLRSKKG